jgi:anti-anti-sigma factor
MKIGAAREGGSVLLQLEGRLDRESAEHLSDRLEELVQDGVRSLAIDFAGVTYVSSAATRILSRWQQELSVLRGDMELRALPSVVTEAFAVAGWDAGLKPADGSRPTPTDLRRSSWHARADLAANGEYQLSSASPDGKLTCRRHGDPERLSRAPVGPDDCSAVAFPEGSFGLGVGAIGGSFENCRERFGELLAISGCVAYFPSDGARMADYLMGAGTLAPRAVLAAGLTVEGEFSQLMRFSARSDAESVPISEIATIGLDATDGDVAGLVIVGETAGLSGARLRRSPGDGAGPIHFEVPAIRDWLSFAPERTYSLTTTLIVGVVARQQRGPLSAHLRPLGSDRLFGHFHAAVFSYHPLPQRTVEMSSLVRGLFTTRQLRDVLHLVWDDRGESAVDESALVRGVGWISPITQID